MSLSSDKTLHALLNSSSDLKPQREPEPENCRRLPFLVKPLGRAHAQRDRQNVCDKHIEPRFHTDRALEI